MTNGFVQRVCHKSHKRDIIHSLLNNQLKDNLIFNTFNQLQDSKYLS